ncbi:MAG: hypothetical protein HRT88_08540 [Lentisphaeraceae bacterium]|nr:hypothetical protein [Lentisphaeraceae bacterium]
MNYWIGYLSENCHHNYGSDTASYSLNEGSIKGLSYKGALEKFKSLVESGEYYEILLFDSDDKVLKSI